MSSSPVSQIIRFWKIWTLPSLSEKKVAVRITITPGINDTLIDARRYAHLLSEHHIRHVILLSYSNLGIIKYEKYTQSPTLAREQTFSGQDMENYANMLRGLGFDVQIEQ